jgi:hypothetical protein
MKAKVETWLEQIRIGAVKSNTVKVLNYIYLSGEEGSSIWVMRDVLGMSHQTLTAVLSVIADEGLIEEIGTFQIDTSWYTQYRFVHDAEQRRKLSNARFRDKYKQWLSRGLEEYADIMPSQLYFELMTSHDYITK